MKNGQEGAFAFASDEFDVLQEGLTKREYFAGLAMQGMLANSAMTSIEAFDMCQIAVVLSDELLKQLEK